MNRADFCHTAQIRFAILDEADRMLSDGFEEDVERILATSPPDRQTLLFRCGGCALMPYSSASGLLAGQGRGIGYRMGSGPGLGLGFKHGGRVSGLMQHTAWPPTCIGAKSAP